MSDVAEPEVPSPEQGGPVDDSQQVSPDLLRAFGESKRADEALLREARRAVVERVHASSHLRMHVPGGALYGFPQVVGDALPAHQYDEPDVELRL